MCIVAHYIEVGMAPWGDEGVPRRGKLPAFFVFINVRLYSLWMSLPFSISGLLIPLLYQIFAFLAPILSFSSLYCLLFYLPPEILLRQFFFYCSSRCDYRALVYSPLSLIPLFLAVPIPWIAQSFDHLSVGMGAIVGIYRVLAGRRNLPKTGKGFFSTLFFHQWSVASYLSTSSGGPPMSVFAWLVTSSRIELVARNFMKKPFRDLDESSDLPTPSSITSIYIPMVFNGS